MDTEVVLGIVFLDIHNNDDQDIFIDNFCEGIKVTFVLVYNEIRDTKDVFLSCRLKS